MRSQPYVEDLQFRHQQGKETVARFFELSVVGKRYQHILVCWQLHVCRLFPTCPKVRSHIAVRCSLCAHSCLRENAGCRCGQVERREQTNQIAALVVDLGRDRKARGYPGAEDDVTFSTWFRSRPCVRVCHRHFRRQARMPPCRQMPA